MHKYKMILCYIYIHFFLCSFVLNSHLIIIILIFIVYCCSVIIWYSPFLVNLISMIRTTIIILAECLSKFWILLVERRVCSIRIGRMKMIGRLFEKLTWKDIVGCWMGEITWTTESCHFHSIPSYIHPSDMDYIIYRRCTYALSVLSFSH